MLHRISICPVARRPRRAAAARAGPPAGAGRARRGRLPAALPPAARRPAAGAAHGARAAARHDAHRGAWLLLRG